MKNLWTKIIKSFTTTGLITLLTLFPVKNLIAQDNIKDSQKEKNLKNSISIAGGPRIWDNPNITSYYKNMFMFREAYEIKLDNKLSFEISSTQGSKKANTYYNDENGNGKYDMYEEDKCYDKISYTSINAVLNYGLFNSEESNAKICLKGGGRYLFFKEKIYRDIHNDQTIGEYRSYKIETSSTAGYFGGISIEKEFGKHLSLFLEGTINKEKIVLYDTEEQIGGTNLMVGAKYNFNFSKN